MGRTWNLLSVPIDSVGQPGGTELAPQALLDAGLEEAVELGERAATLTPLRDPTRNPDSGLVSHEAVIALTEDVREGTAELLAEEGPLLVLGGCCTLVPGVLGGLAERGMTPRIAYVDGHLDLYDGDTSPTGEAADMPLAVALDRGPSEWSAAAGDYTLVPADLAILGFRDHEEAKGLGSLLPADLEGGEFIDAPAIREQGLAAVGAATAERLAARGLAARDEGGFWVHVDLDVLDEQVFPATDAFVPDGLDWDELAELLEPMTTHPACIGVNVVCFNPEKDPDGESARRIVELLDRVLG